MKAMTIRTSANVEVVFDGAIKGIKITPADTNYNLSLSPDMLKVFADAMRCIDLESANKIADILEHEEPDWNAILTMAAELSHERGVELPFNDTESFTKWFESGEPIVITR